MPTLALPTLPVNPARTLAGGLCLVCTTLAPLPSHAFTYDVRAGSVIVQHQSTGTPLVWPTIPIPLRLALGDAGRQLLNGTSSWDDNAAAALAEWTAVVPLLVQQSEAPNVVRWADVAAGEHLGSLAATTQKEYRLVNGREALVRTTTLLNPALCWEAYDGPLRSTFCQGQLTALLDVRRIVLHELGHVFGLEHPDEGGQVVAAIMNQAVSDTDRLQADDEAGILTLYPPQPASTQQAVRAPAAGGGRAVGAPWGEGNLRCCCRWCSSFSWGTGCAVVCAEEGHKPPSPQGVQEPWPERPSESSRSFIDDVLQLRRAHRVRRTE